MGDLADLDIPGLVYKVEGEGVQGLWVKCLALLSI